MNSKMKGLLKGLRYISQIFEPNEKEQEMQIGLPTDVKHVAHIGWDGPSVNPPSWMNEFRSAPIDSLGTDCSGGDAPSTGFGSSIDINQNGAMRLDSPDHRLPKPRRSRVAAGSRSVPESPCRPMVSDSPVRHRGGDLPELTIPRPSRGQAASRAASADSSFPESSLGTRRNKSNDVSPIGSPANTPGGIVLTARQARRHSRTKEAGSDLDSPPSLDQPPRIPKYSRRKKSSRGSSGDGGSSRSKALVAGLSEPGIDDNNGSLSELKDGGGESSNHYYYSNSNSNNDDDVHNNGSSVSLF